MAFGKGDDGVDQGDGDFVLPDQITVVCLQTEEVAFVGRDKEQLTVCTAGAWGRADLVAETWTDFPAFYHFDRSRCVGLDTVEHGFDIYRFAVGGERD